MNIWEQMIEEHYRATRFWIIVRMICAFGIAINFMPWWAAICTSIFSISNQMA